MPVELFALPILKIFDFRTCLIGEGVEGGELG